MYANLYKQIHKQARVKLPALFAFQTWLFIMQWKMQEAMVGMQEATANTLIGFIGFDVDRKRDFSCNKLYMS